MNTKQAIRKMLLVTIWLAIAGGMLVLILAAIGKKKRQHCKDYVIRIKGAKENLFVNENDILKLLTAAFPRKIKDEAIELFNLRSIEESLEKNQWIEDAELYFDNRDVLHINVSERQPIARIFTSTGQSFYIDKNSRRMALPEKTSARVPVFTGFPGIKNSSLKDSALLADVTMTAKFIMNSTFWTAQVAQIDITPQRTFEMVPTLGNHIVRLGDAKNMAGKFHRLFVFYKEVSAKSGFDKYSLLDVQYEGQVVGTKRGNYEIKTDTAQLRLNIEKILREANEVDTGESVIDNTNSKKNEDNISANDPVRSKNIQAGKRIPKAVMKKKAGENK